MTIETGEAVAEAYCWQRRLGNQVIKAACCHIISNPSHPQVWDANHAVAVTAGTDTEIASVFAAMEAHLAHTPWRVVHTDGFTPDAVLGCLALEGFAEQPVTIQMVLAGDLLDRGTQVQIHPVVDDGDWDAVVHSAGIQDRDGGYQGPVFQDALRSVMRKVEIEIVKRSDVVQGFEFYRSNGPSRGRLLGSTATGAPRGIGRTSTERPWLYCAWHRSV